MPRNGWHLELSACTLLSKFPDFETYNHRNAITPTWELFSLWTFSPDLDTWLQNENLQPISNNCNGGSFQWKWNYFWISFFIRPHKQAFQSYVCYLIREKYFLIRNWKNFLSMHEWAHVLIQKCHKRYQTKHFIKWNPDDRTSYYFYVIFVNMLSIICEKRN